MIQKPTLQFLSELAENNHKDWFDENRKRYKAARENMIATVDALIQEIMEFDDTISELEAKNCLFRINRDIRFSKDKSPYKLNLGAHISKGGRKPNYSGYYFQIQPGNCMLAGGSYSPHGPALKKIREHIAVHGHELRDIISDKDFVKYFGELRGDSLKTAPKGFPKDHVDIDLLRKKAFYVFYNLSDDLATSDKFVKEIAKIFKAMQPLNDFLNTAVEV